MTITYEFVCQYPGRNSADLVDGYVHINAGGTETGGSLSPRTHVQEVDKVELQHRLQPGTDIAGGLERKDSVNNIVCVQPPTTMSAESGSAHGCALLLHEQPRPNITAGELRISDVFVAKEHPKHDHSSGYATDHLKLNAYKSYRDSCALTAPMIKAEELYISGARRSTKSSSQLA